MNVSDKESSTGNTVMTTMMFNKNQQDKENLYFLKEEQINIFTDNEKKGD